MNDEPSQKKYELLRTAGQCSLIPCYLAVFPFVYGWIGKWLDQYFGTNWLGLLFVIIGVFSGVRQSYFIVKRLRNNFKTF